MKSKIPFNPFEGSEEFRSKNPKDMSLDELEILLHAKRLNLRLDVERLHKQINYTKLLFDIVRASGLGEMIEDLITPKEKPDSNQI
ncbi:MAG TPA: hypothetical protein PK079_01215 [Leptospiraceae bacterium]|nr:hypothetical protein [Leptospiraceae bacterium]HMW03867.1 hypothetical protein [Leptospiraceae bacterium]HMX34449.1 hypothetical protein [Leptospiraceae bacterium]HMY29847.1 hypothetical protein [Leptospiraceae bacterium]HMZ63009.1 hypothetical protein [Leptospiraceae bacterium]